MVAKYIATTALPPGLQQTTHILLPAVLSRIAGIFYSTLFDVPHSSQLVCNLPTLYAYASWRAHFLFCKQFYHFRHSGTPLIFHCRGPPLVKFGRQPNFTKRRKITMGFNKDDYGSRIRSLRKNRGLTQEQLAEKLNVSTPYIAKIENGKQTGPVELAVQFSDFFEVSLDYLLVGKGNFTEEQKHGLRIAINLLSELEASL